jgi:hypothetical protein
LIPAITPAAIERSAEDANPNPPPRRNLTHGVLSERYHLGGRVETDTVAMAAARQEQAEIQRRHRFERRHGDDPSQTPSFSSLVARHEISQGTAEAPPQRPLLPTLPENQPQLPRRGRPPTEIVVTEDSPASENPAIPRRGRPRDHSPNRQPPNFDSPPPRFL